MDNSNTENRYVAYYRVSTKRQGESGLGLEAQKQSISSFLRTSVSGAVITQGLFLRYNSKAGVAQSGFACAQ
jgi:hypothetical protein